MSVINVTLVQMLQVKNSYQKLPFKNFFNFVKLCTEAPFLNPTLF